MEVVTRYKTDDGSLWTSAEAATERETMIATVAVAMRPLGDRPDDEGGRFSNGHGYRQHEREAVLKAKANLIELTRPRLSQWMYDQEHVHGKNLLEVHPSWFGRLLDGGCEPLGLAWMRLCCIDHRWREWGQPYFIDHPDERTSEDPV